MATFKPVIFNGKNHIKSDGTTNIKIRVYHNRESQYIPTPYYITPMFFKNGFVVTDTMNADTLNYEINEIVQSYFKSYIALGSERTSRMLCSELRDVLVARSKKQTEFIDFVEFSRGIIKETSKENTAEWYDTAINILCWYYKKDKINIRDITVLRLEEFMKQLSQSGIKGKPIERGGISAYMRALRSLFYKCKKKYNDEDFDIIPIPHNPFKRISIPKAMRKRKNLQINTLKQIRDREYPLGRQNLARDMLMIMFYLMGINVNDLFQIKELTHGRVEYERSKTNTEDNLHNFPLSIRIEPELQVLIDKYSENGLFLSKVHERYSNSKNFMKAINTGLGLICKELNIPKVTTNWARHSWASIARNNARIAKADIDFCLGHVTNDHRMADVYIDIEYDIYDDANRRVLDLLK